MMYTGQTVICAFGVARSVNAWADCLSVDPRTLLRRLNVLDNVDPALVLAMPERQRLDASVPGGAPKSWSWSSLPWKVDPWAQAWVEAHPGGASLEEVGNAIGVTRERVRQLEEVAMRKVRRRAERLGLPLTGMLEEVARLRDRRRVTP